MKTLGNAQRTFDIGAEFTYISDITEWSLPELLLCIKYLNCVG